MDVEDFISRWTSGEGGAERANYQLFLAELCDLIGVARPQPAAATHARNDYVFERAVRPRKSAPTVSPKRIDLYKKDAFILEAKQSRLPEKKSEYPASTRPISTPAAMSTNDRALLTCDGSRQGARSGF